MNSESNEMLTALWKFWRWDADWMTCRACKRHLIASRDGEEFSHAAGCKNSGLLHPWRSLRLILNDQSSPETRALPPQRSMTAEESAGYRLFIEKHFTEGYGANGSSVVPTGHFWRGVPESNRHQCRNCGQHYTEHHHTDEASRCPL